MVFDLHSHTTYSDGLNEPVLLEGILSANRVWTVTDHNDIRYHEGHKALLTGTELSVDIVVEGKTRATEVLAYGFDVSKIRDSVKELKFYVDELQKVNLVKLTSRVRALGCVVPDVKLGHTGFAHATLYDELAKYPKNRDILGALLDSLSSFYREGQVKGSPIYIDTPSTPFTLAQTYDFVKSAGGKLFLAHPYYFDKSVVPKLLQSVVGMVDGIECLHPSAGESESRHLIDYCYSNNLLASGGSDYHKGAYTGTPNLHLSRIGEKGSPFNWLLDRC